MKYTFHTKLKSLLPQSTDSDLVRHMKARRLIRAGGYTMLASMAIYAVCFVFPPIHDDASYAVTGTPVASDTTLSISVDNDVLSLDLTPLSANGTFATTATPATVYVTTNNITGYTLGICTTSSTDTATKLVNNIDECVDTPTSTKCSLSTIDNAVSEEDYEATTSTDLNNTWGYLPSKYNSEINENYLPAPSSNNVDILDITSTPNSADTTTGELVPNEYTIDLGSRIDYTPYAGQYSGTLVITAVGNPVPYSVSYDANKPEQAPATANVDNMPTAQTGTVSSGDTIAVLLSQKVPTLGTQDTNSPTTNYTYAGYVFNGWCNTQPTEDPTTGYQTCPVEQEHITLYQPGDTYGIDQTTDNTETLYAVWGAPATVIFNSNGLVYHNTATDTDNTVQYIPTYEGNIITGNKTNTTYTGTYLEPAPLNPSDHYIFKGWSTEQTATEPTYTTEQDIINNLNLNANDNITLYAVWTYTTVITFDKNGADGTETMEPQVIEAGTTANLTQNVYTNTGYVFASWNTEAAPTEQTPGTSYPDQAEYQAEASQSADVTLHVQWKMPTLYDKVQGLVKKSGDTERTQTLAQMQEVITAPDTTDPATDTSNSGVYKYDAATFGTASDASNDYSIYYYRGILEPEADQGTQGSDGPATTYPNYVKLGNDTCWRIVRTTGSGGVKMVYNGVWNTTNNTCANATTAAQTGTSAFNSSFNNAIYVGYTYNNAMVGNTDASTSVDTVFGNNSDTTLNNTRSTIKTYIEDTWYTSKMMTGSTDNYVDLLEPSAGYCNDRTVYDTSWNALTEIIPQQNVEIRFGARRRVGANGNKVPSLTCPRGDVDLYRYVSTTSTTSFTSNELRHPAALLTADEVSLAGSGWNGILPYNTKSFLNSGSHFWLLSPNGRNSGGRAREFYLNSGGNLSNNYVNDSYGVRPAISLKPGTTVVDGEGTATDPWMINEQLSQ